VSANLKDLTVHSRKADGERILLGVSALRLEIADVRLIVANDLIVV
jgi:hypothetical protein